MLRHASFLFEVFFQHKVSLIKNNYFGETKFVIPELIKSRK